MVAISDDAESREKATNDGPSAARRAGVVGGLIGLVTAGAAVGLAIERYAVGRATPKPDVCRDEPFGRLPADRRRIITADDGAQLYVEEVGPPTAPLTVIFIHGYCLNMGCWHYQRQALEDFRDPSLRLVFYDQRAHGRSSIGPSSSSTIDQLGRDVEALLAELSPASPTVLIGHSMGAMAIMALAEQNPGLFGSRIVGAVLISTSTGKLAEVTLGLPALLAKVKSPVLPWLMRSMKNRATLAERGRKLGRRAAYALTHRLSFGSQNVSPVLAAYANTMIAATPVDVIADFFPTLMSHDKLSALDVLKNVETMIVVGDKDVLTPLSHSLAMHEMLIDAQLIVIPDAGHLVMMERPDFVNARLRAFLRRAMGAAGSAQRQEA